MRDEANREKRSRRSTRTTTNKKNNCVRGEANVGKRSGRITPPKPPETCTSRGRKREQSQSCVTKRAHQVCTSEAPRILYTTKPQAGNRRTSVRHRSGHIHDVSATQVRATFPWRLFKIIRSLHMWNDYMFCIHLNAIQSSHGNNGHCYYYYYA